MNLDKSNGKDSFNSQRRRVGMLIFSQLWRCPSKRFIKFVNLKRGPITLVRMSDVEKRAMAYEKLAEMFFNEKNIEMAKVYALKVRWIRLIFPFFGFHFPHAGNYSQTRREEGDCRRGRQDHP